MLISPETISFQETFIIFVNMEKANEVFVGVIQFFNSLIVCVGVIVLFYVGVKILLGQELGEKVDNRENN